MFLQGDLTRRLATELLDKYWNSNSQYMDPSDLEDSEDPVTIPAPQKRSIVEDVENIEGKSMTL